MKKTIYDSPLDSGFSRAMIRLGMAMSQLLPRRKGAGVFLFFPHWHVGGAEKVHADIVGCIQEARPWIFFTHRSQDSKFKEMFAGAGRLFNIWALLKYTLPLSLGLLAGYINRHQRAIVFGCNSRFFYRMVPLIREGARCIDLMHAFGGGSEQFSLPAVPWLHARVAINKKTVDDFREQYRSHGVDVDYLDRIVLIENRVDVPERLPAKERGGRLKLLYVGRGSEEKRVHLLARAATICRLRKINAELTFVGDVIDAVPLDDRGSCRFLGEIADFHKIQQLYDASHLLLLASSREGFPMVIMEAMAHGVVPVSTDVGGIPVHLHHGINGILIREFSEERIVEEMVNAIGRLASDAALLESLSQAAYEYARQNFGSDRFCHAYRNLFFQGEIEQIHGKC